MRKPAFLIRYPGLPAFLLVLIIFLAINSTLIVADHRIEVGKTFHQHIQREMQLLGLMIRDAVVRRDLVVIEEAVVGWAEERSDIIEAKVTFPNGFVISHYSRPAFDSELFVHQATVALEDNPLFRLDVKHDMSRINQATAKMGWKLGGISVVLTALLGGALWWVLRKTAVEPLERVVREKEAAQKALVDSEERFRTLYEGIPISYQSLDADGRIIEVNEAWLRTLGYERHEVYNRWFGDFLPESDKVLFNQCFPSFKEKGSVNAAEFQIERKDGQLRTVSFEGAVSRDAQQHFKQTHCVFFDITDELETQKELRLRGAVLNATASTVIITDVNGVIQWVNPAFTRCSGYLPEEVLGKTPALLNSGKHETAFFTHLWRTILSGEVWRGELVNKRKCGTLYHEETIITPVRDHTGIITHFAAVKQEITKRIIREEALKESREHYRRLVETSKFIPWEFSFKEGRFIYMGPQVTAFLGYPPESWQGLDDWENRLHPEDREEASSYCQMATAQGEDHDLEYRVITADGRTVWVRDVVTIVRGEEGVTGLRGFFVDICRRKELEAQLREAKEAAEKASQAKSAFLAAMSHDIRTPMNAILGMGEMLAHSGLNKEQGHYLEVLHHAGEGLLALINDILDLSKIEAGQMQMEEVGFDLAELILGTEKILLTQARDKGLALDFHIEPGVHDWVRGDPLRLRQVLLNLLGNAIKFTDQGRIELTVMPGAEDQDLVRFQISDTGVGIAAERLSEIFHPFSQAEESTSRRFGGSGLGLAICTQLVALMGGEIGVKSVEGQGSRFLFTAKLPRVESLVQVERRMRHEPDEPDGLDEAVLDIPSSVKVRRGHQERERRKGLFILLADDAQDNRDLMAAFLRKTPHHLQMAENGDEAVRFFQAQSFDLVLMDVQMPIMDGYEATRRIRAWETAQGISPTPIVALTANAMKEDQWKTVEAGCDMHLTKPIRRGRLLEMIHGFGQQGAASKAVEEGVGGAEEREGAEWSSAGLETTNESSEKVHDESVASLDERTSPPPAGHFNPMVLEMLRQELGQDIAPVIEMFLESLPGRLKKMATAMAARDWPQLEIISHQLTGSSEALGGEGLGALCRELERGAIHHRPPEDDTLWPRLEREAEVLVKALYEDLNRAKAEEG
ncbi:MAG: PAS domain S-box protein [Magnetococcales bacterium]|nr:PAS domain S-box protein [Magnetococcales bacterium]